MTERTTKESMLSETQQKLLSSGIEQGYFRVPRETTLLALAEEHEISDVEASEQLRMGIDTVVRSYLEDET